MTPEAILPWVSRSLQAIYLEQRAAWMADNADILAPWPKRRSRKRNRVPPGLSEVADMEEG